MDADFSHNPNDLPRLYDACKNGGADVAIGSRYVKGGGVVNWPSDRKSTFKGRIIIYKNDNLDADKGSYRGFYVL